MTSGTSGDTLCIEHLHREALTCLETFPSKIIELNDFIHEYMPESVKNSKYNEEPAVRKVKYQSTLSTAKNYDLSSVSDIGVSSYYSLSLCDRSRSRHGICKRRYYRARGVTGSNLRRRPGPLGQILAFVVSGLATCTKQIVIAPSRYIVGSLISTFLHRRELKNVKCGPSPSKWNSSQSTHVATSKDDSTVIEKLVDIIRPTVVKLINDTTILKRWLQAVALSSASPPTELTNATKNTETIDCWAYELYFHLKYLQTSPARRASENVLVDTERKPSDIVHANLWHRLVQLRDNYVILYETIQTYEKMYNLDSGEPQQD